MIIEGNNDLDIDEIEIKPRSAVSSQGFLVAMASKAKLKRLSLPAKI